MVLWTWGFDSLSFRMMLSYFHWLEIKFRFFYWSLAFSLLALILFHFKSLLFSSIAYPILEKGLYFIYTDLSEPFFSWIHFSFLLSFLFNLPLLFFHLFSFFKSGLLSYETQLFKLFSLSFLFFFFLLTLLALQTLHLFFIPFFLDFQLDTLDFCGKLSEFVSLLSLISLSLILIPLIILSSFIFFYFFPSSFSQARPFLFFSTFLFSSLVTPPDVFSLFLLALPLYSLFELSFFFVLLFKLYLLKD